MQKTAATPSNEEAVYFRCGKCKGEWAVTNVPEKRIHWYCPWCGEVLQTKLGK